MNNTHNDHKAFDHNTEWQSETIAERYDGRRFASIGGRIYDRMEKHAIATCLDTAESITPIRTMLDLACGTGRISALLAQRGYKLTCGDISRQMLDVARARLRVSYGASVEFLHLDIYHVDLDDATFECVSAFRLFQHLTSEQRAHALREMARLSKRFVLVNVMHTSPYYGTVRRLRRAVGRYTTRFTSSQPEIDREIEYAGLAITKSIMTQPGFNGDRVLLLEKTAPREQ